MPDDIDELSFVEIGHAADTMSDPTARAQTYNKIEQQLVDYVGWLPIYQRPELYMLKPYVVGFKENSQAQIPPNDWQNIYITTH